MGSPYNYFQQAPPQEDYQSAYSRWNNYLPQTDFSSYLDPNSPDVMAYRNAISQPSGANELVGNFANSMPRMEDYNPSFMQRLGGIALGTLEGSRGGKSPYETSRNYVEEPYRRALTDWKGEGQFIDDRARLLEADKSREVKAMEFALRMKNQAAQREAGLEGARQGRVGNLAGQDIRNQNTDQALGYRAFQDEIRNNQRDRDFAQQGQYQGIVNDMNKMKLDYMREHGAQMPTTPGASKPIDPIDIEAKKTKDLEVIKEGVKREIMSDPNFAQYFNPDGTFKPELDEKTKSDVIAYIQGEFKKKMIMLQGGR
jgi:hypothetical protein